MARLTEIHRQPGRIHGAQVGGRMHFVHHLRAEAKALRTSAYLRGGGCHNPEWARGPCKCV
jgi:hypothetical protein